MTPDFRLPPRIRNASGALRKVGIEIEFGRLDVATSCALLRRLYGGEPRTESRFTTLLEGAEFGDWRVEIDSKYLTEQRYLPFLERIGASVATTLMVEDVLDSVAATWIPREIVSPPIPITELHRTEELRRALEQSHAEGTGASLLYVFGFQLNPEIPALDAATLAPHLRAFLALYDWLYALVDIDFTRRLTSFVDPFPEDYRLAVLDPSYAPNLDALMDDYLRANPTRNRALDMLPAFAFLKPDTVRAAVDEPSSIKARPTFHYRLPNCLVDQAEWSFALEWNRWVEIERLAADPERLARVSAEVSAEVRAGTGKRTRDEWIVRARAWGIETT